MHWQIRAEVCRIIYRLYINYGVREMQLTGAELQAHKKFNQAGFYDQHVDSLVSAFLKILNKRQTNFVGTLTLIYSMKFLTICANNPLANKKLAPFVLKFLYQTALPVLAIQPADLALFEQDAGEFIRRLNSPVDMLYDPRLAMLDLIKAVCKQRRTLSHVDPGAKEEVKKYDIAHKHPSFLLPFLDFVAEAL